MPDVLGGIELGRTRRQRQESDVGRDIERLGGMPTGLIEDQDGVGLVRDLAGEVKLHRRRIAGRQNQCSGSAALRADCTEQIGRLGALIVIDARPGALLRPPVGQLVLLPDPHPVLEPDLDDSAGCDLLADFRHARAEVF